MVPLKNSSQLVLLIMVILVTLPQFDGSIGIKKIAVQAVDGVMVEKEILNNPIAAKDTRGKLRGRKMMMMTEGREESNEAKKVESKKTTTISAVEAPSKISGGKDMAKYLKKSPEDSSMKRDNQNDAGWKNSVKKPVDPRNSDKICSQKCGNAPVTATKKSEIDSFQKLDTEKLLEAASQILNLMNKDYPGGGGPSYRPPINNQEPLH